MPIILFSKSADEASADAIVSKFYAGLELEREEDTICGLEFIIEVKDESKSSITKLDIVMPNIVSTAEDLTGTFEDSNLYDNLAFSDGFKVLDRARKKYYIDGIEAFLVSLTSKPRIEQQKDYTTIRLRFDEINPGESRAFRLKMAMPLFANFYNSLGIVELSIYYPPILPNQLQTLKEWGVLGIPINRKSCEIWIILPEETIFRRAYPGPQQIKANHMYHLFSDIRLDPVRYAVYWDLEATVFDLPGRELGDYIPPGKGVRIYCETTKPHVTPEIFETKMGNLQESAITAEKSLNFIAKYGKESFVITLILSAAAIIISAIALIKGW